MTEHDDPAEPTELVRTREFDTSAPIELDIINNGGSIHIELGESTSTRVEVRHDPNAGPLDWRGGLAGLLTWVSEQLEDSGLKTGIGRDKSAGKSDKARGGADTGPPDREPSAEAVQRTRIEMTGTRLAVHAPNTMPSRSVPLSITVWAPAESQVTVRAGTGDVNVAGSAGGVSIQSGSGGVSLERASGHATIRTGSGGLRLGEALAGIQARSGSGDVEIASINAASSVVTGSGNVWLGTLDNDVLVRSGSGDITVTDAAAGQAELITGSGELRVSLRTGIIAEIDLTSATGTVSSDFTVTDEPPDAEPRSRVFGRTGNGDAFVTSASNRI